MFPRVNCADRICFHASEGVIRVESLDFVCCVTAYEMEDGDCACRVDIEPGVGDTDDVTAENKEILACGMFLVCNILLLGVSLKYLRGFCARPHPG